MPVIEKGGGVSWVCPAGITRHRALSWLQFGTVAEACLCIMSGSAKVHCQRRPPPSGMGRAFLCTHCSTQPSSWQSLPYCSSCYAVAILTCSPCAEPCHNRELGARLECCVCDRLFHPLCLREPVVSEEELLDSCQGRWACPCCGEDNKVGGRAWLGGCRWRGGCTGNKGFAGW